MNEGLPESNFPNRRVAAFCGIAVGVLWIAQPPLGLWPAALFALLPWLHLAQTLTRWTRRKVLIVWACSVLYFFLSLQGLRHAHPLMIFPTIALAGYLAVYHFMFLLLLGRALRRGIPMCVSAPVLWVALECIRNYLMTGISALMLAHTMADVPVAIQIADLFGSYGISFALVAVNVSVYSTVRIVRGRGDRRECAAGVAVGLVMAAATVGYGIHRLNQPLGDPLATFALIQRSEPVEYEQSDERAIEIFRAYLSQTQSALAESESTVDAVVWPESMFTAGLPWMILENDAVIPPEANVTRGEFTEFVNERRVAFEDRIEYVRAVLQSTQPDSSPHWVVGCGVVRYAEVPEIYSGMVHIDDAGNVEQWYGKTHLVMFGEYIPIAPWIPGLRSLIPPGMGLTVGPGPRVMQIGETKFAPVICIETAVERVVVNQLARLRAQEQLPDVVVTVTNDGWFDDSAVIDHHLRCGQLVAVATRRPLLSSANNGPTAWIDSNGRVVDKLDTGSEGNVIAIPQSDTRESLYVTIGAWPAWGCVLLSIPMVVHRRGARKAAKSRS